MYLGYLLLLRLSYVSFQEVKSHLSYVNVQNRSDMRSSTFTKKTREKGDSSTKIDV